MKITRNAKWITLFLASALAGGATVSWAAPTKTAPQKPAAKAAPAKTNAAAKSTELPRYVSMDTIKKLREQRGALAPSLQPFAGGEPIAGDVGGLINPAATVDKNGVRIAQVPKPADTKPKSAAKPAPKTVIPRWVRYPLEFQLAGIGLGSLAVDKDKYNRIDRYGLFAIHGNPTAIAVPSAGGGVSVNQQPPEVAGLFPGSDNGYLPDWAAAITVPMEEGHVEWLYRRETYSMGFIVDRLGFVDAIVLAGTYSPIGKTQLEDRNHSIQLGDDLRKVLYRYGYPDDIQTYEINAIAGSSTGSGGAAAGADEMDMEGDPLGGPRVQANPQMEPGGLPNPDMGAGMEGSDVGGGGAGSTTYRTFELRYEQSYNIVFSIRNNRVVRIYIFGDPDFFNRENRIKLRTQY